MNRNLQTWPRNKLSHGRLFLFWVLMIIVGAASATAQSNWTLRNPSLPPHELTSVVWAQNRLLALGLRGFVLTSTNAIDWQAINLTPPKSTLQGPSAAVFTGTRFLVMGGLLRDSSNQVEYVDFLSSDGENWTRRPSKIQSQIVSLLWTGSQLIAWGIGDSIWNSANGDAWIGKSFPNIQTMAWNGTQLVAITNGGKVFTSPDGATWTERSSGGITHPRSVTWSGDQWVVVGDGILTSSDGMTWTPRNWDPSFHLKSVTWAGNQLVGVGDESNETGFVTGVVFTSRDGLTWLKQETGVLMSLHSVTWTGAQIVAVGYSGAIISSPDGISWTNRNTGVTTNHLTSVTWMGNQFVAAGYGTVLTSVDGVSWVDQSAAIPPKTIIHSVVWTGNQLVALGLDGSIYTSEDGLTWNSRYSNPEISLYSVASTSGLIVAVGNNGTIVTSPDGMTWTSRISQTNRHLNCVIWTGNRFIAMGSPHTILTSPNGIDWTTSDSGVLAEIYSLILSGSQVIAVGNLQGSLAVMTSPDGIRWTHQSPGLGYYVSSIAYGAGQFVAVGEFGTILTSPQESFNAVLMRRTNANSLSLRLTSSRLFASLPAMLTGQSIQAHIYKVSGNSLVQVTSEFARGQIEIPIGTLPSGLYVFEAWLAGSRVSKTFVK